ncbi:amidohydrolase family protein [Flavobacterium algicola]|uniref:amidohydrolase family protein n=1 Tax=Flavobacterium algicola TaxID=556529 RepID=UPI001EFD9694|nr:amidohydrolase family protein [Flavobacterium algicola]MCG9793182.1 amidohydrolase family protein [Flavobacterium algicola]
MRIDSHQHFWNFNPVRDSWIDDSMTVIKRDFLPQDLQPILEANKIEGCIAVQADQSEEETTFLLQLANDNSFIKGVVGWVDLRASDVEDRLGFFSKNNLFKGVRHIVQAESEDFLLRKDFRNGISKLEQFGLVYDLLIYPNQLKNAIKLVQEFHNQQFVINHIAKPKIDGDFDSEWEKQIRILATCKNVNCKVSGLVTETADLKWNEAIFTPYLDVVVDAFGIDRLLFGSDWPVCLLAGEYREVLQIIENYFAEYSKEDKEKIMGQNAIRIYKL